MSITRSSWRTQPIPTAIEELIPEKDSPFARHVSSPDVIAMLRAGYVPEDDECMPFLFCEENSVFFYRSWNGVFMYRFEIGMDGETERVTRVWVNNDPSQFRRTAEPKHEFLRLIVILEQAKLETQIATRDSWKIQPMPEEREKIAFSMTISRADYEMLKRGEIPMQMEDKWFKYVEDDWLYLHRSWTGVCVFQVRFEAVGSDIVAVEAWANRNPDQYKRTAAAQLPTRLVTAEAAGLGDHIKGLIDRRLVKYYRKQALHSVKSTNPVAT